MSLVDFGLDLTANAKANANANANAVVNWMIVNGCGDLWDPIRFLAFGGLKDFNLKQ